MAPSDHTNSADGIPDFLRPHFADIAKSEGLTADFRIEYVPGAKPGGGFMSDMLAITLVGPRSEPAVESESTLTKATDPADTDHRVSIVCKLQPSSATRKEQSNNALMFEREVFLYNRLFPLLNRLQRVKGLNETNGGFYAVPRCYVAAMDVFADESYIIMEDMRAQGFQVWPKEKTVTFEHAKLVLQQLGRFHGLSFVLRDQRPEVYADFIGQPNHYYELVKSNSAKSMFDSTFRRAARLLERPADKRLMEKLRDDWMPIFMDLLDTKKMGNFAVFGHSDLWNNNLMYQLDGDKPTAVRLLDWQFARPVSPADDFIMYLCSTTEKPLRDQHYDDFLHIYHDSLTEIVRSCGSDPDKLFTFEDFLGTLKTYGNYGVLEAALTISLMVADDVADIDQLSVEAQSLAVGGGDADAETGHFVHFDARTQALYVRRLQDVLEDARNYGWFSFDVVDEQKA